MIGGLREQLRCIQCIFTISSGQGTALNIDPYRFAYQSWYNAALCFVCTLQEIFIRPIYILPFVPCIGRQRQREKKRDFTCCICIKKKIYLDERPSQEETEIVLRNTELIQRFSHMSAEIYGIIYGMRTSSLQSRNSQRNAGYSLSQYCQNKSCDSQRSGCPFMVIIRLLQTRRCVFYYGKLFL